MQQLRLDDLGRPVPWFVCWIDGKPEFRVSSQAHIDKAIRLKLCWVCGSPLGTNFVFVAGPMCGINRISAEPPSHIECGRWSARNCPFLSNPNMVRREDAQYNNEKLREDSAGFALARNPRAAMVLFTREYEVVPDGKGKILIMMGVAYAVEWYACGREATREEVEESIETGFPALLATVDGNARATEQLYKMKQRFEKWLPKQ